MVLVVAQVASAAENTTLAQTHFFSLFCGIQEAEHHLMFLVRKLSYLIKYYVYTFRVHTWELVCSIAYRKQAKLDQAQFLK